MKKTLAILLSCMLIVGVVFALALTATAEEAVAASVKIAHTEGETTLDATTTSLTLTTGTATFDAATGTLTLNGTTGIYKITPAAGAFTVKVEGENTVNGGTENNILWSNSGSVTVIGTGTLNLSGKEYVFGANGDVTVDGPTVNVNGNGWTTVHIGGASLDGVMTFKGNSVVKIVNAKSGPAIDVAGICSKLVVTDNAKLTVNTPGTGIQVRSSMAVTEAFPKHMPSAEISGKAQVVVEKGNQGLQVINQATTAVGFTPSVIIKDEASFTSKAGGQGIVVNADVAGADKAVLQILDKANVDIECLGAGNYQQGIDVRGGKSAVSSDVDITTTGTVKVKTNAQGWNGAFYFRGGKGHDVLIKDANIEITNPGGSFSQVAVAFYAQVQANITVAGNAKISAAAQRTAADAAKAQEAKADADITNRSFGLYLAAGSAMTIKDNAVVTASSGGDAKESWNHGGAATYLNASSLTVEGNAVFNSTGEGKKLSALCFEGASTFNVKGNAVANLKSTSYDGLHTVSNSSGAVINVTEGGIVKIDSVGRSVGTDGKNYTFNFVSKAEITEKANTLAAKEIAAPANLKAGEVANGKVTVTWDAVPGAVSYVVEVNGKEFAKTEKAEVVVEVEGGKTYAVTVKAVNAADVTSAASAALNIVVPVEGAASAVTLILADSEVVLNAENATVLNGAASFDAATGILTLNNASGIQKITWTDGALTINVKGTNTVAGETLQNNIWGYGKDANLTVTGEGTLNVTGKAYVLGSQTGDLTIDGPTVNATSTTGTGVHVAADGLNSSIIVKGASKLNITSKGYAMDAAGIAPSIIIKDTATVKIDSKNVGMTARANKVATDAVKNNIVIHILDKANVEINSVGSGIAVNGKVADNVYTTSDIVFSTSGTVTVNSTLSGWGAAAIFFTGSVDATPHNFTVKNGTLNVNITQNDGSEVACGIYTQSKTVVVVEDATVNATVDCSSTVKTNRGQAIYFAAKSEATFKGKTVVNTMNKGSAKDAGWHPSGASLHVHGSTLTIEGNAVVNAKAEASVAKITGLALQDGKVIVKGNGKLNCESANQAAIFNWDGKTNSLDVVENGIVTLKGTSGIRTSPTFTLTKDAVLSGKYTDKELTITSADYKEPSVDDGNNKPGTEVPPTSDADFTAALLLGSIAALAGLAVVVLRKKAHN